MHSASATVLSGDDPLQQNTLEVPNSVVPRSFGGAMPIAGGGKAVQLTLPAWSLVVLELELGGN